MDLSERFTKELERLECDYAFYYRRQGERALSFSTREHFRSASILKVPILLAWLHLEQLGEVDREELCDLDAEPQVQGSGLSWLLRKRVMPYHDALLLMIALSDNLCTNLVIRRAGIQRLNQVFGSVFGLQGTRLERRFMDYEARAAGLDNWISAGDCVRYFDLLDALIPKDRAWVDSLLAANTDDGLLMRNIPRDTVTFYHKTGSMEGVLHDWGYSADANAFLLTENVSDETNVYRVLDALGPLVMGQI